ncbi:hypothetical protein HDU76_007497, partial [Blyttiomyces sp. JEL0837]
MSSRSTRSSSSPTSSQDGLTVISDLPLEIITNIIKCLSMSKKTFQNISLTNRQFRNALQIIPKCISLHVFIGSGDDDADDADFEDTQGTATVTVAKDSPQFSWDQWADKNVWWLSLGSCQVHLNAKAIPKDPQLWVGYVNSVANATMFREATMSPVQVFVPFCDVDQHQINKISSSRQQYMLRFIGVLSPGYISTPWHPQLFTFVNNIKSLDVKWKPGAPLIDCNPLCDVGSQCRTLSLSIYGPPVSFEGLQKMLHVHTLHVTNLRPAEVDVVPELLRVGKLPNIRDLW